MSHSIAPATPRRLSLRRNLIWNFGGVSLYNFSQWLLLLVLARLSNAESVGSFSLMLAISAPVFLTVGMNLRIVQATDARRIWRLEEYFLLRQVLNGIAITITMILGFMLGQRGWMLATLAVVCVAKSLEAGSQVFYGYFQLRERLDLVSRSLVTRAIAGPCLFLVGFWASNELAVAAAGLVVGWGATQLLLDQRNARRLSLQEGRPLRKVRAARVNAVRALAVKAAPLGVDQGVTSLSVNIPRYVIKYVLGTAHLGVFASQAYLGQVVSMATGAMSAAFVPRMAVYYHEGRRRGFIRLLLQLVLLGFVALVGGILFALFIGDPFIRVTLGPDYVNRPLLIALMAGAGVTSLQRSLCKTMEASQSFGNYLLVDSITAGVILASAFPLVRLYGMVGAAYSIAIGNAVGCVAVLVAMIGVMRKMPKTAQRSAQPDEPNRRHRLDG